MFTAGSLGLGFWATGAPPPEKSIIDNTHGTVVKFAKLPASLLSPVQTSQRSAPSVENTLKSLPGCSLSFTEHPYCGVDAAMNVRIFDPNASTIGPGDLIIENQDASCVLLQPGSTLQFNATGGFWELAQPLIPSSGCLASSMDQSLIRAVYQCAEVSGTLAVDIPLATADLNGDGIEDLVGIQNEKLVVLTFRNGVFEPTGQSLGRKVLSVDLRDIDGDGVLDAAVGQKKGILVLLNDGQAGFNKLTELPTKRKVRDITAVDVNNDGYNDLISTGGSLLVFLNHIAASGGGDAPFVLNQRLSGYKNTASLVAVDMNNDGEADIAAGGRIYLGRGDGTFVLLSRKVFKKQAVKVMAGDLDQDGDADLVVLQKSGCAQNDHHGHDDQGDHGDDDKGYSAPKRHDSHDNDDHHDQDHHHEHGCLISYFNDGTAHFTVHQRYELPHKPHSGILADLDNDGDLDCFVGTTENKPNEILLNDGSGAAAFAMS